MRLQVGRAYWTRDKSAMVKIEKFSAELSLGFHYIGSHPTLGLMSWRKSGRYQHGEHSRFDLVAPVTPDSKWKKQPAGGQHPEEREGSR